MERKTREKRKRKKRVEEISLDEREKIREKERYPLHKHIIQRKFDDKNNNNKKIIKIEEREKRKKYEDVNL